MSTPDYKREYSATTLEAELLRRKERIPGAIAPEIAEIMDGVRAVAVGDSCSVLSSVKGENGEPQTYLSITRIQDDVYTIFTFYVQLDNHRRGPCHGIGDIEPGYGFAALGGNSMAPATGFANMKARPVYPKNT